MLFTKNHRIQTQKERSRVRAHAALSGSGARTSAPSPALGASSIVTLALALALAACAADEGALAREGEAIAPQETVEDVNEATSLVSAPTCRNLCQGDPYFPTWIACCDGGSDHSYWVSAAGAGQIYDGSCASWTIEPVCAQLVCRDLCSNDPFSSQWASCCDLANHAQSYWVNKDGSSGVYNGSCGSWGIQPACTSRICRVLKAGDPFFDPWTSCCDDASSTQSYWGHTNGGDTVAQGSCASWGIAP